MPSSMQSPVLELSPFLTQLVTRNPDWLESLKNSGRLESVSPPAEKQLAEEIKAGGLDAGLRRFRNREMMRLIWRDLSNLAPVDEILEDLSTMADVCLQAAVAQHTKLLEDKYGIPRNTEGEAQKLVVIGLGKLGGNELNLSSDIDIIFCFPDRGVCDGRRGLANEQFFTRLARQVIRSLSEITADGFCFRVDTRLRPFGDSGPLVCSFSALEQYYQREGRDWERYALIKARPVAGELASGQLLLNILKPFVYRRYIDFGAIDALREMHANVREDALRKDRLDDIKRGPGGIREIEFLVQTFQLLRGGRERLLQTASIIEAVAGLQELALLRDETASSLLSAYRFLRRTENRIQALHDQQTHRLPEGEDGLRVARAMGYDDFAQFQLALEDTRSKVQLLFEQSLPQPAAPATEENPWHGLWQSIKKYNLDEGSVAGNQKPLTDFVKRLSRLSLSQRASRRLDQYMPVLLEQIHAKSPSDAVVVRVLDLVSAICRRSAYLALLVQNPGASQRMLDLFSASQRIAQTVTRYPALLDELIDPSLGARPPDQEGIQASIDRILNSPADAETTLGDLNYLKQVIQLRIAVAMLQTTMSAHAVGLVLSQLAQGLVQAVLSLALLEMRSRHGDLPGPQLTVVAYGSLGACNLGFDSDLDLIFLYQPMSLLSDGKRPITAERYHTGVARRMLGFLSVLTPSGRLYNIDARLRPNGRAGLLVSSVKAFKRYQMEEAWCWELQALTRARAIAGDPETGDSFRSIRKAVLSKPRDIKQVKQAVLDMRARIQSQHGETSPLKYGHGGLLDIEFIVQLGLLLNTEAHPQIIGSTEIDKQLQALLDCGWLDSGALALLQDAYSQLSEARQRAALLDEAEKTQISSLLNIAQALCNEILR